MSGYTLDYNQQCASDDEALVDKDVIKGLSAAMMLAILALAGLQMQISPNLWVMINTLQILRTILLLKINLPVGVRQVIVSSSVFSQFDFGVASRVIKDPTDSESIMQAMNGDDLLGQYFEEYGIDTYRFIDYVASVFFDVILLFVAVTLGFACLS